jgi:phage N-6-adenine-methyltransferase
MSEQDNKFFARSEKTKDEWLTPPSIVNSLGEFDLDPSSPINRPWPTAKKHYTIEDDGLKQDWEGRVWMNPPYGSQIKFWMNKLSAHGNGIALVFARTESKWFHKYCWEKATGVFFFKGRIAFHHVSGEKAMSSTAASCLIAYGSDNAEAIKKAIADGGLNGVYINIR